MLTMRGVDVSISSQRQSGFRQDAIEAGILSKVIPHGIQFQIAVVQPERQLHQFAQFVESAITVSRYSKHLREAHLAHWAGHGIHARRKYLRCLTSITERFFILAEHSLGDRKIPKELSVIWPRPERN